MASHNEPYDSRAPRLSRANDSYARPREDQYLKPTTGATETRRRVGETSSESRNGAYRKQPSPSRHGHAGYDTRYDYPPPLPPDTGPPPRHREHSKVREKRSWPPQPTCEDEVASLVREAGSQKLLQEVGKSDIPSRGTIDQEALIEEVPEFINRDERRFVLRGHGAADGQPTPPTSDDEKARRKARRRPSKLDTKFNKVEESIPEMNKRTATPYAFSKPGSKPKSDVPGARFLSPEDFVRTPSSDSTRRNVKAGSRSQPSSPGRDSARRKPSSKPGNDYFSLSSESAIDDSDYDARARGKDKLSSYSSSRETPNNSPQTSVVDFAPPPKPSSIRRANLDARRNTDTESTLPTMQRLNIDKSRRPTPLMTATALSGLGVPVVSSPQASLSVDDYSRPRSRESSYVPSNGPSPASSTVDPAESAYRQRSPRVSAEFARDDGFDRPPTRESSVSSSRPQSPSPRTPNESPRLPKTELDWSALLAANNQRRPKPPSRLSSAMQQESTPPPSRGQNRQSSTTYRTDSLPYPVDDGPSTPSVWMPSEKTHQFFPDSKQGLSMPPMQEPVSFIRAESTAASGSGYPPTSSARSSRPSLPSRYSATDLPQPSKQQPPERPRANESRRAGAIPASSQTKKDIQALSKKPLPPCPRIKPVSGYSDWYTLIGAPNLHFCPDCVTDVFDRTIYRNSFRRAPPMNLDTRVRCAFGGMPWVRLAWLLTLQQQRVDLRLLQNVGEIEETSTPCPKDSEAARTWYGLRDKDGIFVKDFRVCYSDVRKIESLLPSLSGMFVRLPQRTADEIGLCAVRPDGNRFSIYLDALISTHEDALSARSTPDPGPFITLVQWRSRLRECTKDGLIRKGLWHFIPSLPELTICEDCFATMVEPEVEKDNDIAMRFHRTLQPVYNEGIGVSCQLYSPRMRKVFLRAVRDKDLKYLARKARERRDAELRLQERYRAVVEKAKRVSWGSSDGQEDERRLEREMRRIAEEWQAEWE